MGVDLLPVWKQIVSLHAQGISLIPVRDKDDDNNIAKTPYTGWAQYQKKIIPIDRLFTEMDEKYNTTAIAMICGAVSGNMFVIDVDVKYYPGIDGMLFDQIKSIYPELWERLRIHKSPSGGYHIIYRCTDAVPGNLKLAKRNATDAELTTKPKTKTYCYIETRGEGGYVLMPPSMGYTVSQDRDIPVISNDEHEALMAICRNFNELVQIDKYTPTKADTGYYDTNPFEDFNNSTDAETVLQDHGWKFFAKRGEYIHFTRPDKDKGTSATFNLRTRVYYNFTSTGDLEEDKGYQPSTLLSILAHNGDKKETYRYLVNKGFGKIKYEIEQKLAKRAAVNGTGLPTNISDQAKESHDLINAALADQHPYGVFWIDTTEGVVIDREKLYVVCEGLGFRLHEIGPVQIRSQFLHPVNDRYFFDTIKEYIQEEDAALYRDICNAYEVFIERHGKFTISRLPILTDQHILSDSREISFKPYLNGVLQITAESITLTPYDLFTDKLIWHHSIQQRNYTPTKSGRYIEFINLATNFRSHHEYIMRVCGYLAHDYKDETTGYIIVLTESCEDPKDGGGSGKNVFSNLFRYTTTYTSKPGSQVKYDEKFLQSWKYQRILCISDVPKNFDFSFLKELSTGEGLMKKLFKDEVAVSVDLMPKFLIQTNFSYEIKDGGVRRRVMPVEFTDFFTKAGGIDVHFGVHFPNGWTHEDWGGYDSFIANSIQKWLAGGLKLHPPTLTEGGWIKQFEQTWGVLTTEFIKENIQEWHRQEWLENGVFKTALDEFYRENNTPPMYRSGSKKINQALAEWCKKHEIEYLSDVSRSVNNIKSKWRFFGNGQNVPF